jgi:hypothetical protein
MPGIVIIEVDAACGHQAFGDGGATFLGCRKQPHELYRQVFPVRPTRLTRRVGFKSHAVDIHGFIPPEGLTNRRALGKREHHATDAWRPVISNGLRENEVKEAAQDIAEVWHVTPLMAPRA